MSASAQTDPNAVRMASPFTVAALAELYALRRTRDLDGAYPDLGTLAGVFGVTPQQANLALDALLGRTPEEAFAALQARAPGPRSGGGVGSLKPQGKSRLPAVLRRMFGASER